jgi:1A family penicillin-binding protein
VNVKLKELLSKFNLNAKNLPLFRLLIVLIVSVSLAAFYFYILKDLPLPTKLSSGARPESTLIYDRNGELLYNIHGERNQISIPLSGMPQNVKEATIAIEDKNFYHHGAIDLRGMARAAWSTIVKQRVQGGSTLTQQLVKNSLLSQERTVPRKVKEILLAFATEFLYTKDQILEMYLNQTPYGGPAYGIEAASQMYFDKHAKDLTLSEAALLAGLPQSPTRYSPFGAHPELAKQRQLEVLKQMEEAGYISKSEREKAAAEKLAYKNIGNEIFAPHFVLYVKDLLIEKYGNEVVEEGGLRVTTSLDLEIQRTAEASVAAQIESLPRFYRVSNGAALVTNPATGEILAMVGSKNYFDTSIDGNVNLTTALRQPGSSIKPVNYAVGLIKGYSASTAFVDQPTCFPNQGGRNYCPRNYDNQWHGLVQIRSALANSYNIPAVKMLKVNTLDSMIATASAMGITTYEDPTNYGLSLTLGGGEVRMTEMATAFGVFANGGYRINLHPILKVVDKRGKILEEYQPPKSPIFGKKVFDPGVAFIISDILSDNAARTPAFGPRSELVIPGKTVSVKTGTTNDYKDNWTIGYTPSYLVATWVGNFDNTAMNGVVSGVTGAAPIWNDIMSQLLKDKPNEPLSRPSSVIQKRVCADTGIIASEGNSCETKLEYFISGTESKFGSLVNREIWVKKGKDEIPEHGDTQDLELKGSIVYVDPTGDVYCLSCSKQSGIPTVRTDPTPTSAPNPPSPTPQPLPPGQEKKDDD